jgi:hypothetical protein
VLKHFLLRLNCLFHFLAVAASGDEMTNGDVGWKGQNKSWRELTLVFWKLGTRKFSPVRSLAQRDVSWLLTSLALVSSFENGWVGA